MLEYLNTGWDWFHPAEAYPWLLIILLGDVLLGYCVPIQKKLAGNFQCSLAVLMRNGAGKLLVRTCTEDGMRQRRCPADRDRSHCAPCHGASFPVLSEAQCKDRDIGKCPMAMIFWPS